MKIRQICIIVIMALIFFPLIVLSQEAAKTADKNKIKSLNFEWPFDKPTGFLNYAQELIFNKDKGTVYLEKAKEYYNKGYSAIALYQPNPNDYDLYSRDRYKIDAVLPMGSGDGIFRDFRTAEYWFLAALDLVDKNIKWDSQISVKPEYKELVVNSFKNLLYVCVYNAKFEQALQYLNTYKSFAPDEAFINEWEARIFGNVVIFHKAYDWAFTGKQSYEYLKTKHKEYLLNMINKYYGGNAELKKELENRIYPETVILPSEQKALPVPKAEEKKEELKK